MENDGWGRSPYLGFTLVGVRKGIGSVEKKQAPEQG